MNVTYRTMRLSKYLFSAVITCFTAPAQQVASLNVSVLTGTDVIVSTREGRGADIKVRVTSSNDQPVEDATVTAILPAVGAGGAFAGGETVKSKNTDSDGTVDFTGIRIRRTAGDIPIRIVARLGRQTGTTMAHQKASNVDLGDTAVLSKRRMAMMAIIGGGVTAAVLALIMDGDTPAQPAFNVTPGIPVTTGPR
jgi:hypothetical protein